MPCDSFLLDPRGSHSLQRWRPVGVIRESASEDHDLSSSDTQVESLLGRSSEQEETALKTLDDVLKSTLAIASDMLEPVSVENLSQKPVSRKRGNRGCFDLTTAVFCGGLAFDAYVEPPRNSSRWEKGSTGLQVAFVSNAFTRQLYQGLVEITVERCTGLPDDDNAAEKLLTGSGVDACVLVAAVEGSWKEDIDLLEKKQYHDGIQGLSGAAHVVRSSTAWANVNEQKSKNSKKMNGKALPYHVPGGFGRGGQAVWPEPEPFYLYVQDPANARLVFTVMDEDSIGEGSPVGSTWRKLSDLIPQAGLSREQTLRELKGELLAKAKEMDVRDLSADNKIRLGIKSWQGQLKLTSKPRKKDKNGQILGAAAAGAYLAGPVGAAAGAVLANMYEGEIQGTIHAKIRYLPIPDVPVERKKYTVLGGMEGITWGDLFEKYTMEQVEKRESSFFGINDLEHCFFLNHERTGATCAVYRSLEKRLIVVSFRGTCTPIDLVTDASIVQDAWIKGEETDKPWVAKVHSGFRSSLESISRRLKELLLATVPPGDAISDYDMLVTGHSLGGALATLFTADIGQYGIDAGRSLPQLEDSDPWWKSLAGSLVGQTVNTDDRWASPPRPKSLRVYSFGSPRVGNKVFTELFDALVDEGMIQQAYRVVNGEDVVTRMPRSVNALVFGEINYDHCGATVLVGQPSDESEAPLLWIEGESDDRQCPVRDGVALTSPLAEGTLLADLYNATRETFSEESPLSWEKITRAASKFSDRFRTIKAVDVTSILGIDKDFTEREMKMVRSIFAGEALKHHMEDEYYSAIGRACGFIARIGENIEKMNSIT